MPHNDNYLFTSESVSMGHPDKMADQISDGILDAILQQDPYARVACETLLTTGLVCLAGEITTTALVDYPAIVREIVREIGYTSSEMGFDASTCAVMVALGKQSPDIAQGVDEDNSRGKDIGAGDQGMMFGFACNDTPELMPLPIALAHRIINRLTALAERRHDPLAPTRFQEPGDHRIRRLHAGPRRHGGRLHAARSPGVTHAEIVKTIRNQVIEPILPVELTNDSITCHINPTGKFVIGGPHGDSGVTGRKIIVDTYGGMGRHGGGAFSGKDPTKVDRSAAYMARHVAKNIVAAGLAERCEIQLAYAIGVSEPVSVHVDTQGTGTLPDMLIAELVRRAFPAQSLGQSSNTSTCGGRSTARRPAVVTSVVRSRSSPGKRPTKPTCYARRPTPTRLRRSPETCDPGPFMAASWESLLAQARTAFTAHFGGEPAVAAGAPGRVELLGNHTDYNGGLVMAAAIDRSTVVVGRRTAGRQAKVASVNFGQTDKYPLDAIEPSEAGAWTRYVRGVCWALTAWCGPLASGFEAAIAGDVPLGAGLSSSASLQASVADVSDPAWSRARPIELGLGRGSGRSPPDGPGQGAAAVGERLRRGRLGSARPVFQPLRPRRLCPVPRLRHAAP